MTDTSRHETSARQLGALARAVDGSVAAAEHAAGLEGLERALGAERGRVRYLPQLAALVLLLACSAGAVLYFRAAERIGYQLSGASIQIENDWLGVPANRGAGLLAFSEGTEIELAPGSQSRIAELTADGARIELGGGSLRARVVHRPRSRWHIGAGPYSIDVTGTAFDVDWSRPSGRIEVRLHRGSVVVRGPSLHDGVRLTAGQRLVGHATSGDAELSSLQANEHVSKPAEPAPVEPVQTAPAPSPAPVRVAPSWADMVANGNFRGVLAQAEARGVDTMLRRAPLVELVALSDAARYAGEHKLARRGLLAQRARFAASAEAHAAAFLLGRMADDEGSLQEALGWYGVYLREAPRGDFAAEALGRKLAAVVRTGDAEAAVTLAGQYLQQFPRGAHADYAREVVRRR